MSELLHTSQEITSEVRLKIQSLTTQLAEMREALENAVDDLDIAGTLLNNPRSQYRIVKYWNFSINRVYFYRNFLAKYPKDEMK